MILQTVFGEVSTRETRSRLSRASSVFLKDNPNLTPVFEWLKKNGVRSVRDIKSQVLREAFKEIEFNYEVKWSVDENFWVIHFHNVAPYKGKFPEAIQEYLSLFKRIIERPYKQDKECLDLLEEIEKLEVEIQRVKESLKEGEGI